MHPPPSHLSLYTSHRRRFSCSSMSAPSTQEQSPHPQLASSLPDPLRALPGYSEASAPPPSALRPNPKSRPKSKSKSKSTDQQPTTRSRKRNPAPRRHSRDSLIDSIAAHLLFVHPSSRGCTPSPSPPSTAESALATLRTVLDAHDALHRALAQTQTDLGMSAVQLRAARAELARTEAELGRTEAARRAAEEGAANARGAVRRMEEERAVSDAREQGRRFGYEMGLTEGRMETEVRRVVAERAVLAAAGRDQAGTAESRSRPRTSRSSRAPTRIAGDAHESSVVRHRSIRATSPPSVPPSADNSPYAPTLPDLAERSARARVPRSSSTHETSPTTSPYAPTLPLHIYPSSPTDSSLSHSEYRDSPPLSYAVTAGSQELSPLPMHHPESFRDERSALSSASARHARQRAPSNVSTRLSQFDLLRSPAETHSSSSRPWHIANLGERDVSPLISSQNAETSPYSRVPSELALPIPFASPSVRQSPNAPRADSYFHPHHHYHYYSAFEPMSPPRPSVPGIDFPPTPPTSSLRMVGQKRGALSWLRRRLSRRFSSASSAGQRPEIDPEPEA
ncbi:unnamed protein product [Mycena citricolor]|uniref:Uncharacterized protein n=1 Tax=Mycena citricolor TaxID=2018698 RepID=A0AAD2GUJ1_9AGAR|nr:unnamed protein product [Mycena citricolor]